VDQEEAEWNVNISRGRRVERQLNCKKYYFGGKGGEGRCSEVKSWYVEKTECKKGWKDQYMKR